MSDQAAAIKALKRQNRELRAIILGRKQPRCESVLRVEYKSSMFCNERCRKPDGHQGQHVSVEDEGWYEWTDEEETSRDTTVRPALGGRRHG